MAQIESTFQKLLECQNLTFEESHLAMQEIMTGTVSEAKLAAWLTALRMKGETADEIGGCASVMREYATRIRCADPHAVDIVGTGGDQSGTLNVSTTAALIAAGAGATVAKHGNRAVSSKSGSADLLKELGVNIEISPEKMEACLAEIGIAFLFAPLLHPAMRHAMPVRKELGIRTIFNILGPLCNPARVGRMVLGVFRRELCSVIAEALNTMGIERAMVVFGEHGADEITICGQTRVCEARNGQIEEYTLHPRQFGFRTADPKEIQGGAPARNAEITRGILAGNIIGPMRDIVVLNAAAALLAADKAENWETAIAMATDSINSGNATKKLDALIAFTRKP
jgi:anthranilate phosphoribosyltransferase